MNRKPGRVVWLVGVPFERDVQLFEYACHEGNDARQDILAASRDDERTVPRP